MEFEESLRKAGLTGNESIIYLQLLKYGEKSANDIAKNIGMDRTLVYTVLNNLIEKGFVNYVIKESKKFFRASDPSNLLNSIKEKEIFIRDLIGKLKSIKEKEETKQEIDIYEGKEAIRTIFNLFKKHNEIYSFGATGKAYDYLYESSALTKELIKKGLKGKIITSRKYAGHPMTKIKNVEVRYFEFDSEATTTLSGDYVIIHIAKDKPFVILIKNKEIAQTYFKHFQELWKIANK